MYIILVRSTDVINNNQPLYVKQQPLYDSFHLVFTCRDGVNRDGGIGWREQRFLTAAMVLGRNNRSFWYGRNILVPIALSAASLSRRGLSTKNNFLN